MPTSPLATPDGESLPSVPGLQAEVRLRGPQLTCSRCQHALDWVEQSRRSGSWLGSLICANCRSEYFYAYRWGRLVRRT